MKKILYVALLCLFLLSGCYEDVHSDFSSNESPLRLIQPGSVFEPGCYISFENLDILYNGDTFAVTNNREDIVRISVMVVGPKNDGSYDIIQWPAFSGTDDAQYQKDLKENGWAINELTNMVRPKETLMANLSIFEPGDGFPSPDINADGYYEIVFCVHPQESEDTIQTSTEDPVSEVYKLKVS